MAQDDAGRSVLWVWLNITLILFSAVIILIPQARHWLPFQTANAAFAIIYFIFRIRLVKAQGMDLSIGKLHEQARAGRLPKSNALDNAAIIALLVSSYFVVTH
jgi:hypothetical protein